MGRYMPPARGGRIARIYHSSRPPYPEGLGAPLAAWVAIVSICTCIIPYIFDLSRHRKTPLVGGTSGVGWGEKGISPPLLALVFSGSPLASLCVACLLLVELRKLISTVGAF